MGLGEFNLTVGLLTLGLLVLARWIVRRKMLPQPIRSCLT